MTQDQSRAEFEAWWSSHGQFCLSEYDKPVVFRAWQAARAAAPATTQQSLHVDLPEAQCEVEVRSHASYVDHPIYEWRDNPPDGTYKLYTEQQVRTLLEAAAQHGGEEAKKQAETRMDTGVDRGCEVLPGVVVTRIELSDEQRRGLQADCDGPIPSAAPALPQGWVLVPVEPTAQMLAHAEETLPEAFSIGDEYRAMLSAAPQPPKEQIT